MISKIFAQWSNNGKSFEVSWCLNTNVNGPLWKTMHGGEMGRVIGASKLGPLKITYGRLRCDISGAPRIMDVDLFRQL